MKIINKDLIISSKEIKSKNDLFKLIAEAVEKAKRTTEQDKLFNDLVSREKLGSTAFQDGLMIPHCRSKFISETSLVIVDFNDVPPDVSQSIDGKATNFAVAILVPEEAENEHLKILSKLSSLFSTKEALDKFKKNTADEKISIIEKTVASVLDVKVIEEEKSDSKKIKSYDFVAVTSCAAGIAHTYMARDGLVDAAKKMGLTCKVETRGAVTENKLSPLDIDNARFVIIAADVNISKKPFLGKKIYETDTNSAIKDGKAVIDKASKTEVQYGKGEQVGKIRLGNTDKSKQKLLSKSMMSALSFMIPVAITGGILMAIPNAIAAGGNSDGGTWTFPNNFTAALWDFGHVGLILMVPVLSMFLAFKIGGKPAIPAALIGGYFINDGTLMYKYSIIPLPSELDGQVSAGFLGGLAVGIIVGYMVRWSRWIKWNRFIQPVSSLMIIPIFSSFLTFLIVVYVIGSPMTWIMSEIFVGLNKLNTVGNGWASIGVGILFAGLMAIDLGGPINKTTLTVATIIFTTTMQQTNVPTDFTPQTAVQAAISIPPMGMFLSTTMFRKKFSTTERAAGSAALPMALVGVTEGALPFAFATPWQAIVANVSGSIVGGFMVSLFDIHFYGGLGSVLGPYIGYMENGFYGLLWILSIMTGAFVTAFIYGFLRKRVPEYEEQYKEEKRIKSEKFIEMGLTTKKQVRAYKASQFRKNFKVKFIYCINPKHWIKKPEEMDEEDI